MKEIVFGCRVPRNFFTTKGKGESDITVHAGSYHLALKDAGIEMCNIMTYSSILPAIAEEIVKPELLHGSVMETIMAVVNCAKGETGTAGIITGWLYDKETGEKYGGLVCEHNGIFSDEEIREKLEQSLQELYTNGFREKFDLKDVKIMTESITPEKEFGTALVAICFTDYKVQIFSK